MNAWRIHGRLVLPRPFSTPVLPLATIRQPREGGHPLAAAEFELVKGLDRMV